MEKFIGEEVVDIQKSDFKDYGPKDWALLFICKYGGIDGSHHKDWVMDQVARILLGTPVLVRKAKWESGFTEYRFSVGEPTEAYYDWVDYITDGTPEDYDEGIAP